MEEKDYYEALGMEAPGSENTPEAADPAAVSSENTPEAADPAEPTAQDGEESPAEAVEGTEEDAPQQEPSKPQEQPKAERAKQAAQRRARERQAAIDAAMKQARDEVDQLIKRAGLTNPMQDGAPIEDFEGFRAFVNANADQALDRKLRDGTATVEDIRKAMQQPAQAEEPQGTGAEQLALERARLEVEQVIAQVVTPHDPEIRTVEDLMELPEYPRIHEMVMRGYDLGDAYTLVFGEQVYAAKAKARQEEAAKRAAGKQHLQPSSQRGTGAAAVPADEMHYFKALMPNASAEEIQKFYNDYHKRG